ncbi:hypothetical protein SAMN05421837_102221 [Amycolatopsis pretoriensis]|uniref:Uncharacterized protein n=1 Tax=Amycolatopsis pretoriensis TaxID=218821 RepID=A0A1H5QCE3_9PSEU|nr:hypothetical protein SAMN05421837_102221 [Amycolatopsis pretoriensis]
MYRIKPSKPSAVFGAIVGLAMIVVVLVRFPLREPFVWLWLAVAVGVVGFSLWAAFAKRGAEKVVVEDRPPSGS